MNTPGDVALLRNTANTMHCEITATYAGCGSDPLIVSRAITPRASIDPVWWAQVGLSGSGVAESKSDALESSGTALDPQRILPGQTVSYRGFTCTERTNGTTCINTRTGHGFLITSRTIKSF